MQLATRIAGAVTLIEVRQGTGTKGELKASATPEAGNRRVRTIAEWVLSAELDLDTLKSMNDEKTRETIMGCRGFGRWSADYILVRGLARPDSVSVDDIGIRSVVGQYMGDGQRASAEEVTRKLEPLRPYRGLLSFYLLAQSRLAALDMR